MARFLSWKQMAARRGTSVSTEKRLQQTDPRYPKKVRISEGRVGFPETEADDYDVLLIAECDDQGSAEAARS